MQESELTEYVRTDLEKIGYVTYAEVCLKGGGDSRADMYARVEDPLSPEYGMTIAFEAKLSFNLKVIEQAYTWRTRSHKTFIIVPTTYKNMSSRRFARQVCKKLGIGVMEVNISAGKYNVTVEPELCQSPKIPHLYPEQRNIIASNSDNKFMTPFKATVNRMSELFKKENRIDLNIIVKSIKHHYKSDMAAKRNIKSFIEKGVIKGYYIIREWDKLIVCKQTADSGIESKEENFFNQ